MILNALHGDRLPVYGDGMQVRNWIHSTDFSLAIGHVLEHGVPGEVYNAGGNDVLHLHVETRTGGTAPIVDMMRRTFQITPEITLLARGTIAKDFEANVKAPRFVDKRG